MTEARTVVRLVAALACAGVALPVLGDPAQARSCAGGWEDEFGSGSAVAIVTRTDVGDDRFATFRVERSFGLDMPPTVTGRTTGGMDDAPHVYSQELTALGFRREGGWVLACDLELGEVFERFDGPPRAVSTEPPVAVAAGGFGGSSLVTLDRFGRPVAWSRKAEMWPGWTAVCPEGRRIVTLERDKDDQDIIAVYDVTDLKLLRADRTSIPREPEMRTVECTDPRGDGVVVKLERYGPEPYKSRLTLHRGSTVSEEPLADEKPYDPDFYRILEGDRVVEIPADSPRLKTPTASANGIGESVVAPDGRVAAAWTYGTSDDKTYERRGDGQILILDQKTQQVLARWKPGKVVTKLAWTASGTLIARLGYRDGDYSDSYRQGEIARLDRDLRVLSRGPGRPGQSMTVVGDSAVLWGRAPMRVSTSSGRAVDFKEQRLAATGSLIPLGEQGFVADEAPPDETLAIESTADSTDRIAVGILVGLALAMSTAAAGAVWRRTP